MSKEPNQKLDARTIRLVIAARNVAFGGLFAGAEEGQRKALRELDRASESFASEVPWEDEPDAEAK